MWGGGRTKVPPSTKLFISPQNRECHLWTFIIYLFERISEVPRDDNVEVTGTQFFIHWIRIKIQHDFVCAITPEIPACPPSPRALEAI